MTTMADMVADARRHTYGSMTDQINLVAQTYSGGATQVVLEMDVSGITPGMVISSGLNVWYVKGTNVPSGTVYVIPGYDNAPLDADSQVGDIVYIKPRVTDWYLFNVLNDEILRLSSPSNGLYKIASWSATVDPTWQTYAIPSAAFNMIGLLRARYRVPGSEDVWLDIPEKAMRIQMNTESADSYIRILRNIPSGTDIEFLYKSPFTQAESLSDDVVADCGLTSTMVDIPPLGAQITLLNTTEARRNQVQTQGDSRRPSEVPAGANRGVAAALEQEYKSRIHDELSRLVQRNPYVRSL